MRLETRAIQLLRTLSDDDHCRVYPLDFTALLYLQSLGYAHVSIENGYVVAGRTPAGLQFASDRAGR